MRSLKNYAVALAALLLVGPIAQADDNEKDSYAAVGYSTKTGNYWLTNSQPTKEKAESELKKHFKDGENPTIISVKNCYLSIASSSDGKTFGVGDADTSAEAGRKALADCRKHTRLKCAILLTTHTAQGANGDTFSSIAYSTATGKYAASVSKPSKTEAEREAHDKCNASDAQVVITVKNQWCCLALGKDKSFYGIGVADDEKEARRKALEDCEKKTTDCRVVLTIEGTKQNDKPKEPK